MDWCLLAAQVGMEMDSKARQTLLELLERTRTCLYQKMRSG